MAGRLWWPCMLLLVLDIRVEGEPLRWNTRPSTVNHTIDLAQFSTCQNSIATMDIANAEDILSYSLVDQKPDGKFVLSDDRIYCNETALRSNGHSSYILSVSVTDGVTYVNDNFTVTVIGLPRTTQSSVSTTGAKTLASSVQSTSFTVTATDGWTNGSTLSSSVSVPITIKTLGTTESVVSTTGTITLARGVSQDHGVNTTYTFRVTATDGATHGLAFSSPVSLPITIKPKSSSTDVGLIVGIVVGVVFLILIVIVIYVVWQRKVGKKKFQPSTATYPEHSVGFTNYEYEHTDLGVSYIGAGGEVHVSISGAPTTVGDSKVL